VVALLVAGEHLFLSVQVPAEVWTFDEVYSCTLSLQVRVSRLVWTANTTHVFETRNRGAPFNLLLRYECCASYCVIDHVEALTSGMNGDILLRGKSPVVDRSCGELFDDVLKASSGC
jgi:hypothetical protein